MSAASGKSESRLLLSESPFQRGTEQDAELGVPLLEDDCYDEACWPSFPDIWQVRSYLIKPALDGSCKCFTEATRIQSVPRIH